MSIAPLQNWSWYHDDDDDGMRVDNFRFTKSKEYQKEYQKSALICMESLGDEWNPGVWMTKLILESNNNTNNTFLLITLLFLATSSLIKHGYSWKKEAICLDLEKVWKEKCALGSNNESEEVQALESGQHRQRWMVKTIKINFLLLSCHFFHFHVQLIVPRVISKPVTAFLTPVSQ